MKKIVSILSLLVFITNAVAQSDTTKTETPEEIPLVFTQWWWWLGLVVVLLIIRFVVFKKK